MHKNKIVASSVYQKNVVDHMEELELKICEELSEEEMMMVRGGRIKEVVELEESVLIPPRNEFFDWLWNNQF